MSCRRVRSCLKGTALCVKPLLRPHSMTKALLMTNGKKSAGSRPCRRQIPRSGLIGCPLHWMLKTSNLRRLAWILSTCLTWWSTRRGQLIRIPNSSMRLCWSPGTSTVTRPRCLWTHFLGYRTLIIKTLRIFSPLIRSPARLIQCLFRWNPCTSPNSGCKSICIRIRTWIFNKAQSRWVTRQVIRPSDSTMTNPSPHRAPVSICDYYQRSLPHIN